MKFTYFTSILTAGLASVAYAVEAPIPGYGVVDLSWEVQTTPGGPKVNLNGTVQEVHEQLLAINPNYEQDFAALNADEKREFTFEKRDTVTCYQYPQANHNDVESGIKYLRGVPGQPTNGPGPNNCGRVSCGNNAGIWWCNDNTFSKTLPSFNNIADGAQVVENHCWRGGNFFSGKCDHADHWSVIVKGERC
ncbi:hypothetical protein BDV33DRAFT_202633 [Aspergillus novoparasiticus]|uniref:Uncharacterized protein n=1 Tax=Aspergillus novoparasiticus TaxID=986946 RepID=A0A5N6EXQ0_9EURO|nr:hypothetical protein BDV33DRAFT_202633 [Aspergillus novoparasiticus]